jgi:hypothetical protein
MKGSDATSPWCDATVAHRIMLFVGSATTPDAAPTVEGPIEVPAENVAGDRDVTVTLDTPLPVPAGDSLFVAVEMVGDAATGLGYGCIGSKIDTSADPTLNWWSAATMAPYAWVTLTAYQLFDVYAIEVDGQ